MDRDEGTEATRAVVGALYAHYAAGEIEAAATGFSEDVDWAIMAPPHLFAFAGPRRGRASVLGVFREIAQNYEFLSFEVTNLLADGDGACATLKCVVRHRETGAGAAMELCDVMRLKDGQVVWYREFMDAADVALVLNGAWAAGGERAAIADS